MLSERRVLILSGHPRAGSLTEALAEAAAESVRAGGSEVRLVRLSTMRFDPDLTDGYHARKELEPDLVSLGEDIGWCNEFILIHPLWWGSAPAKLKGVFDRLFLPGIAFRYRDGASVPDALWAGRTARVLIVSDTPAWFLRFGYRNGWPNVLRRQILDFVGLKVRRLTVIGPVRGASAGAVTGWFAAARRLAAE